MTCHSSIIPADPRPRGRLALGGALLLAAAVAAAPAEHLFGSLLQLAVLTGFLLLLRPPLGRWLRLLAGGTAMLLFLTLAMPFFGTQPLPEHLFGLTLYADGLQRWAAVLLRGGTALGAVTAVLARGGAAGMVTALAELPLPRPLPGLVMLSWLQLHLLQEELRHRRLAVELRGGGGRRQRRALAGTLGLVFRRSLLRAERLSLALELRGDGQPRLAPPRPGRLRDRLLLMPGALALAVTLWLWLFAA